jgi:aryl-alcohol dehydrogenase-like predicted oxidoreductase
MFNKLKSSGKKDNTHESNNPGRRSFLKTGATLGAAFCLQPALGSISPATSLDNKDIIPFNGERRILGSGKARLEVSALGFGCMGLTSDRGRHPDKKSAIKLLHQAVDYGVNFFDTAEYYGPYINERLVGEAFSTIRNKVLICTKFGFTFDGSYNGVNSRPEHIRKVVEASLKNLKTDRIDLLYQHRLDPKVPIEDVAGTIGELIKEGKVLHYGLCEVNGETIRKAHTVQPITAIQSEYHIMWRQPEEHVLDVLEELGIGFVPYSPVNRAYLTGNLNEFTRFDSQNDNRPNSPTFTPEALRANLPFINVLYDFGKTRGATNAQVALAWLMSRKPWIVPIPGTTKLSHLEENLRTVQFMLSAQELQQIDDSIGKLDVTGKRNRIYE